MLSLAYDTSAYTSETIWPPLGQDSTLLMLLSSVTLSMAYQLHFERLEVLSNFLLFVQSLSILCAFNIQMTISSKARTLLLKLEHCFVYLEIHLNELTVSYFWSNSCTYSPVHDCFKYRTERFPNSINLTFSLKKLLTLDLTIMLRLCRVFGDFRTHWEDSAEKILITASSTCHLRSSWWYPVEVSYVIEWHTFNSKSKMVGDICLI